VDDVASRWILPLIAIIAPLERHAVASQRDRPDHDICRGVSSSMVMNIPPFADPGFCRTRTSPTGAIIRLHIRHNWNGEWRTPCSNQF